MEVLSSRDSPSEHMVKSQRNAMADSSEEKKEANNLLRKIIVFVLLERI